MNDKTLMEAPWYYSIELPSGAFTKGAEHRNVALTRSLVRGCHIDNQRCLDIGSMDFLMTLLMLRRKAARVVAYDRAPRLDAYDFIKRQFNVDFDYIHSKKMGDILPLMMASGQKPFDVVIFSGVLYHMMDPLAGLALTRGLVRNGGLVVIETAAMFDASMAMYFNAEGRYYQGTNYFQVGVNLLDYLLRLLRLAPLDMAFLGARGGIGRVAVVCRATDDVLPCEGDTWMPRTKTGPKGHFDLDFSECLDWDFVQDGRDDVPYVVQTKNLKIHPEINTVNLYEQIVHGSPMSNQMAVDQTRLRLGDLY